MAIIRLDKFLSSQLNVSRTDAKKIIRQNSVKINGKNIKKAETSVKTDIDEVSVDGKGILYKEYVYIMQNKPKGVVSATTDLNEKTVIDILPEELIRSGLFPAGRLDKDTTGFVLITDNGEFAHNILSPSHHVKKTYITEVEREVTKEEFCRFLEGMLIGEELFKPAELKFLNVSENGHYIYEIKIVEGRYHQIKRMFASTGNHVKELKRIAIGGLFLDEALRPGESREISVSELSLITDKSI